MKKDILYNGLPAVWYKNKFLVFSPYLGEIIPLTKNELENSRIKKNLEKRGVFGQPDTQHGDPKIIRVVLVLTSNCRLHCKYCFARGGENDENMDIKTAISSVKAAWKEKQKTANSIEVLFFGGEASLRFDIIKEVINFTKKLPLKNKYFFLPTDGLLNDKQLDWLLANKVFLSISCDGPPNFQNYLRPINSINNKQSSSFVEKIIKKCVGKKALFIVRPTITKYNRLPKVISYLANLGVKFVHFEMVAPVGRGLMSQTPLVGEYIDDFLKALKIAEERKVYLTTSPLMNLFSPADYFCIQVSGGKYIVLSDGTITLCYFRERKDVFDVGKVKNNELLFNKNKIKKLVNMPLPEKCNSCAFKYLCSGGCPAENLMFTGEFQKVYRVQCDISYGILVNSIVYMYNKYKDKNKNQQHSFLPLAGTEVVEQLRVMKNKEVKLPIKKVGKNKKIKSRSRACI